ncbi:hypothetical protein ACF0H5_015880 [Mactra antiquata]
MAEQKRIRPMSFPEEPDGPVMLEYVMVDFTKLNMTTRTWVENFEPQSVEDCQIRVISQYETSDQSVPSVDIGMRPVFMCKDPFRQGRHKLVLCEPFYLENDDKRFEWNTRAKCVDMQKKVNDLEPLYAFEQEYYVVDENGIPLDMYSDTKGRDYDNEMDVGKYSAIERDLAETHLRACIYAGLKISGMNRECHPSEWEYQVGPLSAVDVCDQVVMSRYILRRLAEMNQIEITFINPECTRDTDCRSALHLNFSTHDMRGDNGMEHINKIIENLRKYPQEKLFKYYGSPVGLDIYWFLSGECYMPVHDQFVAGTDKVLSSIRIPLKCVKEGKGYVEERRPMSNADPYEVCVAFTQSALSEANGL